MFTAIRKILLPGDSTLFVRFSNLLMVVALLGMNVREKNIPSNYLHTSGNQILDSAGRVVGLSGVNWFGFETEVRAPHGLWQRNWGDMLDQIKGLGYNVIRLPFSNDMLVSGVKPTGIDYQKNPDLVNLSALEVMDRIITGAGARGIRVILDNHRATAGGGPESNGLWYTSSYSESRWIDDWKMLANRYKGNDTVIGMDLRNEPFGGCWGCGDPSKDWRLAAEKAGNAILSVNPDLLIVVEGIANYNGQSTWWGGNLIGAKDFPITLQVPNRLVYSAHEYPASMYAHPWFSDPNYPNNLPAVWDKYWGYLATNTPILIGEFGTRLQTEKDRQWFQKLGNYIQAKHLNWTFWSLNPNSGDTGGLLLDDWLSVQQEKQNLLKAIQYPFMDSGIQPFPSITVSTPAPIPTNTFVPPPVTTLLDDFESGHLQNWSSFRSDNSNVSASVVSPGQFGTYALKIDYTVGSGGWAGIQNVFVAPQNWSLFQRISFGFYGTNSGATIRFEILNNRGWGSTSDTAERFEYKFSDNFNGWRAFDLPWNAFVRRSDWQPEGAPNDGFGLGTIWGFNISPVNGQGSFQVDDIKLISP
jgi:endoglucanase